MPTAEIADAEELCPDLYSFDQAERTLLRKMARVMAMDWLGEILAHLARYLVEDGGRSKVQGAGIRAFVFASAILPSMHGLTQVQLGELLGLHKQSVGRQVSRFRDLFGFAWGAMQSEQARQVCREREQAKRVDVNFAEESSFEVQIDFQI